MKKETLEALFKKGYITENTLNKGIKKFSDGGAVTPNPIQIPQANPQSAISPSVTPEVADAAAQAQQNTALQEFAPSVQKDIQARQAYRSQFSPSPLVDEQSNIASDIAKAAVEGIAPKPELKAPEAQKPEVSLTGDLVELPKEKKVSPYEGIAKGYDEAFAQMQKGIMGEAEAGAKQAAAMTSAYTTAVNDLQNFQKEQKTQQQIRLNDLQAQAQKMEQSIDEFKKASVIDPNKFWANKTTGDKIMASIAVFLGGLGGGNNQALGIIDNAITRDIEAQKQAALGAKGKFEAQNNIYRNMLDQFQNETAAFTASRLAALNIAEMQLKKAEVGTANTQAKARAQMALGQLGLQKVKLQQELLQQVQNSPQALASDQETKAIMRLPENLRQKAFEEQGQLKSFKSITSQLEKDYRDMAKLATVKEKITSPLQSSSLMDLAQTKIFPAIKKIVDERMSDADARIWLEPYVPKVTDSNETIEKKLKALKDALNAQIPGRTPILSGFGIVKPQQEFTFKRND